MNNTIDSFFQDRIFSNSPFQFTMHNDRLSDDYHVLTHWHEEIEILYFTDGEAYAICNQEKILCKPGEIIFFNSYCFHSLEPISETCSYTCLFFGVNMIESNSTFFNLPAYCKSKNNYIDQQINIISNEFVKTENDFQIVIKSIINSLIIYISRYDQLDHKHLENSTEKKQSEKMRKALFFINHNLSEKITLEDMCELTLLSPSRFSSLFKLYTGNTLIDYINITRCQYARSLYLTGKYTVTECAEKSGYVNMPYFARKYRELYGITLSKTITDKS